MKWIFPKISQTNFAFPSFYIQQIEASSWVTKIKWKTIDKWQHQRVWFLLAVSMRRDWSNLWRSIWETIEAGSEARKQNIKKQTLFFASFQIFGFDRWVFGTQLRQVKKRSKYKCYCHFEKSKYKCIYVTITLQVEKASKHKCYNLFAVCKSLKVS